MQEQFIRLAEVLAAIDRQSELLKSLIEEKWFVDATKKKTALEDMMMTNPAGALNDNQLKRYRNIVAKMMSMMNKEIDGQKEIAECVEEIDGLAKECGWRGDTCHLLATLARVTGDEES